MYLSQLSRYGRKTDKDVQAESIRFRLFRDTGTIRVMFLSDPRDLNYPGGLVNSTAGRDGESHN